MTEIDTSTSEVEAYVAELMTHTCMSFTEWGELSSRVRALAAERDRLREERDAAQAEDEKSYQVGLAEGYEKAAQDIDLATGGDGEYFASTFGADCRGPDDMVRKIAARFTTVTAALTEARAETGAQIERAALACWPLDWKPDHIISSANFMLFSAAARILALSPDATAALAEVRRAAKAEGMREAAEVVMAIGAWGDMADAVPDEFDEGTSAAYENILARAAEIEKADHLAGAGNPFTFSPSVAATLTEPTAEAQAELDRMTVGYLKNGAAE